ncbi:MAG: ABC transporter ATP-binding protein [Anaerolineae bacterium]|nr:ABC transporter ATP-binding protein [Anaerolineae bacterium]
MGFFAGLNPEKYDRQYSDRALARRILSYFKSQARRISLVALLVVALSALNAATPVVVGRIVDALEERPALNVIWLIGFAMLALGVLTWGLNWARRSLSVRAVGDVALDLRGRAFRAAADHDLSFYDQFSSGRIVSRITSDTNDFGQLVVILTDVAAQMFQAVLLGVILFNTESRMAWLMMGFVPIALGFTLGFRALARRVTKRGMQAMADVNAAIKETVSGISIAKNFRQEQSIFETFDAANQTSYAVNVQRGLVFSLVFPILNAMSGIFVAVLVYAGGLSVGEGVVTAGAWYLFILSLDSFMFPILNLASFWAQIQSGLSAAERVFALIDADPNIVQTDSQAAGPLQGQVRFEQVRFQYKEDEPILADFNLLIQPGENLALVGHTGAGKSSIAKLIARFYEFQSGALTIDGRDIRSFDLQSYRRRLGIVSQVPFLFSGTVAENIRYAAPHASESEMTRLARQIGDGEWLDILPDGLDSQVGERGNRLSMGQRQLVALMRVLVQKPAIFILDEATASIDPFTEWQIQQALNLILKNATSILIAHRLSTVKAADRIVVMQKGAIIEEGNHDELLRQGGHYAELYNTYFRHQSLAYIEQAKTLAAD